MLKLGVLISGGGSNLQAILNSCKFGILKGKAEVAVVVSNRRDAYGLQRAVEYNIPAIFIDRKCFPDAGAYCMEIKRRLQEHRTELVCLAGYLLKLEPCLLESFKIINIHPALLPKYGGKGMYGRNVHEAVIKAGEKESGATVHWVDERYDHGNIILQKAVPVLTGYTPEVLAAKVLEVEHDIYPEAILKIIKTTD